MTRLNTPASINDTPTAAHALLHEVEQQLGVVPNLFRVVANSPAALSGYLHLNTASAQGGLDMALRERIALAVAELNGCGYCLAAHAYLGRHQARLSDADIEASRRGASIDPQADAAVRFAAAVVQQRGKVSREDIDAARQAGFDDARLIDILLVVALNTFTNYVNEVAQTEVDFPAVARLAPAADRLAPALGH